jgi:hypothetical protein
MDPLKYFHVNWVDGMKINKQHFIAMENALNDQLMETASMGINNRNYGLLPTLRGKGSSLKMELNADNQNHIRVTIQECRAITLGGARIEILENNSEIHGFSIPFPDTDYEIEGLKESEFYVVLSIQPYSRIPIGNANPDEEPPRYPYSMPEIKAHILPDEQVNQKELGAYFIRIGKVKMIEGQPEIINKYIPPSCSIQSHMLLKELHSKYDSFFSKLELNLLKILRKIHEKEHGTKLTEVVSSLSTNLLFFISNSLLEFRWKIVDQPPINMFEFVARSARIMKNAIESNSGKAKEELLNYFTDWCNLNQGEFEKILINTVNFKYEHTRILDTAVVMNQFVDVISTLFDRLSDLEYIGKKKDTGIFVKEQKGKTNFLAD